MGRTHPYEMPESNQEAEPGSFCGAHDLYQTLPDERGRTSWSENPPKHVFNPAENSLTGKKALLVRWVKCYDGKRSLEIDSIIIQSQILKDFLATVMKGYPGLTFTLARLEFKRPFKPFVHRWTKFGGEKDNVQDPKVKAHVDLLYGILKKELHDLISEKNDLLESGVITHELLWALFEPGIPIFSVVEARQRAFSFLSGDYDRKSGKFKVIAQYIDWDGTRFGHRPEDLSIDYFEGTSSIRNLSVFPLAYHVNHDQVSMALSTRGKLWASYKGYHYKYYKGPAKGYSIHFGREMKFKIDGRVVIDAEAFNTFDPENEITVSGTLSEPLSTHQLMIATPLLRGYALKEKMWLEFFIDGLRDITWNSNAFDSLVLPHAQQDLKKLILGFVRAQSNHCDKFDDIIQGKGRGVIMLLSGPPGVGKTLTAESVAEVMKVPLYTLSAGDLGTTASKVERSLRDILKMVPRWNAIILLDEADVFMEARDTIDLQRNELVTIFLRLLEYYESDQGILFLTTNRAAHIDPAFDSRIHVSIRYPELNATSRRHIWNQFITDQNIERFSETELDLMSSLDLNGRQIKNLVRTAHLLAQEEGSGLSYSHVRTVLNLRNYQDAGYFLG
ncbi:P-loop containing nucleoside triphosphate hydrolase protein [Penicillium longicatenatum]|nr:P-loop containing nucleoside triphosphate hydrolase protein [Penicillium longicatenatum]